MPLDNLIWSNEDFKRRCVGWKMKYSFWPRKCHYTGKWLWLTLAYQGIGLITGPGEPVVEVRWCDRQEYLFLKIKGTL